MPKTEIDYSNTIIYKITCKDINVKDVYVGHTTNFVQRKHAHKQSCINDKTANHKCKLYEVIRNNGGWENWQMEIINFFNCHDHYEARQKEQEYFILLHATLNSIEPMPKPKPKEIVINAKPIKEIFYCDVCDIQCETLKLFETHKETKKHKKNIDIDGINEMEVTKHAQNSHKLICELCDYSCSRKNDMLKHYSTVKHKLNADGSILEVKNSQIIYNCICGKKYLTHGGFWKHKQKCNMNNIVCLKDDTPSENVIISHNTSENIIISNNTNTNTNTNTNDISQLTNLVIEVVKNNSDFQKQMFEMCRNMQSSIITNCNNTTNNTTFNLQVFLNEYCKDAMNISEFIDSFDLQISDLENVGRLGYIEGMSNIIISKINELDVNKRPIHCSDLKREIIYIKDDDVWEREDANNTKFRKVVKKVTGKNIRKLSDWRNMYPDCMDIESEYNDIYMKLIKEAMGPNDTVDNETRIMKKVVKHVVIDKKMLQQP